MNYEAIPETIQEALEIWDSGRPVWTIEMGGLGPGYEQTIQVLVFELLREFAGESDFAAWPQSEATQSVWRERRDAVVSRLDGEWGFSAAQVGAASSLAIACLTRGYRSALRTVPEDRLIQASNALVPRKPVEVKGSP